MPTVSAMGDPISVVHDHAVSNVNVLANDTNSNSEPLVATLISGPSHAASYSLASDGAFAYAPTPFFVGTDYLTYEASSNGETSQAFITIDVTNQTPWLMGQSLSVSHDRVLHNIDFLQNASDNDGDALTVSITSGPAHGAAAQNQAGLWDYTPDAGWTGTDTIQVTASDGIATTSPATISFDVTNAAPTLSGQMLGLTHDQVLYRFYPLGDSSDADGDALTAMIVSPPTYGQVDPNGDGTFSYYPAVNWTGSDTFTVSASDGLASSLPALFTINVNDNVPTASNATFYVEHDQVLPGIDLSQYFADADYDPLRTIIVSGPGHGAWTQNDDGTYIYAADANYIGTDTVTIKANDGVYDSMEATLTIYVTQYAPTSDNAYTLLHDRALPNINFALNDPDANGDPSSVIIVSGPSHGTMTQNTDGTWNLSAEQHYYGSDAVTISANGGASLVISFVVTDNAPVARHTNVPMEAYQGVYSDIEFLANATDRDGDALTLDIVSPPQHGSLEPSFTGKYDYRADTGFLGRDSFSVRYFDGAKYSETVTTDILVYDATTDFASDSYVQGFDGLTGADFVGLPSGMGVRQRNLNDCWFVAAEVGLAQARPFSLRQRQGGADTPIIVDDGPDGAGERYTVTFPGRGSVAFTFVPGRTFTDPHDANREMRFSTNPNNGDWSAILEQAWAYRQSEQGESWPEAIKRVLDSFSLGDAGIRALTGNSATYRAFSFSAWNSTTANIISTKIPEGWIITASTGSGTTGNRPEDHGLDSNHCYTVLGYDAESQQVHLRNPLGRNRDWFEWVYITGDLTPDHWSRQHRNPRGANGEFWLPLRDFCDWLAGMHYETY